MPQSNNPMPQSDNTKIYSDKPDPRHKTWECKRPLTRRPRDTCDTLVDVNSLTCHMCGYTLTGVDKVRAVDANQRFIGRLWSHDSTYNETIWEYDVEDLNNAPFDA
ncbi:hypothetical protein FPANT_12818 [Fusarium pseudoanthophilum]|uniref:Uncharacterized protein n=1 Tax=Fusarium pseudoanthophilum TaxID=48495 RepID=A0A8H5KF92_9HYPO|nr:hypothetical protein FPANT_12818 [Fusarium pseudoanthophilum]